MTIVWAPYAERQLREILATIRAELSPEDASRWYHKIIDGVAGLVDFPGLGSELPEVAIAPNSSFFRGLRQLVIKPCRVVYEVHDDLINIVFCQHCRQLVMHRA